MSQPGRHERARAMQSSELLGQLNPSDHAKSWRRREGLMFRHEDAHGHIVAVRSRHCG